MIKGEQKRGDLIVGEGKIVLQREYEGGNEKKGEGGLNYNHSGPSPFIFFFSSSLSTTKDSEKLYG